jgi:hypothetical protein
MMKNKLKENTRIFTAEFMEAFAEKERSWSISFQER